MLTYIQHFLSIHLNSNAFSISITCAHVLRLVTDIHVYSYIQTIKVLLLIYNKYAFYLHNE